MEQDDAENILQRHVVLHPTRCDVVTWALPCHISITGQLHISW